MPVEVVASKSRLVALAEQTVVRITLRLLAHETFDCIRIDVDGREHGYLGGAEFRLDEVPPLTSIVHHLATVANFSAADIVDACTRTVGPAILFIVAEPGQQRAAIRRRVEFSIGRILQESAQSLAAFASLRRAATAPVSRQAAAHEPAPAGY